MKQLLIIRVPKDVTPGTIEAWEERTANWEKDSYDVIIVRDNVERVEFEIIYNPHFRHAGESIGSAEPFKVEL